MTDSCWRKIALVRMELCGNAIMKMARQGMLQDVIRYSRLATEIARELQRREVADEFQAILREEALGG